MPSRCQTSKDVASGAKVCDPGVRWTGMYCKGCGERMMADGTWTEAHAKRQSELNAMKNEKERARLASLSVEKKEARRARKRNDKRVFRARNRDAVNTAERQRIANIKLDPVKWEALRQEGPWPTENKVSNERQSVLTPPTTMMMMMKSQLNAKVQRVVPVDDVIVISDDEDEGAVKVADDSSGSDVEGIEFVSSDDEQ
jgi:hypothetical protein